VAINNINLSMLMFLW
jgi:spore coat protein U-like protein